MSALPCRISVGWPPPTHHGFTKTDKSGATLIYCSHLSTGDHLTPLPRIIERHSNTTSHAYLRPLRCTQTVIVVLYHLVMCAMITADPALRCNLGICALSQLITFYALWWIKIAIYKRLLWKLRVEKWIGLVSDFKSLWQFKCCIVFSVVELIFQWEDALLFLLMHREEFHFLCNQHGNFHSKCPTSNAIMLSLRNLHFHRIGTRLSRL